MESYKCRLCFKSFINGRALGGHMRSHMRSDDEEDEERPSLFSDQTESGISSSSSEEEGKRNELREKKHTFTGSDLLEDDESEAESSRNLTRKRSKRILKLNSFTKKMKTSQLGYKTEPPHSSASDTTTEEDLAFCLMMLSRDKWKKKKNNKSNKDELEEIETEESEETHNKSSKKKGKYKCETCGKVFKSYQALGGHRASHKKNKVCNKTEHETVVVSVTTEKRIHECPICLRVFSSGQALGGHKRSHGVGNLSVNHRIETVKERMLDLNLPAPTEEDEVSMVFQ